MAERAMFCTKDSFGTAGALTGATGTGTARTTVWAQSGRARTKRSPRMDAVRRGPRVLFILDRMAWHGTFRLRHWALPGRS